MGLAVRRVHCIHDVIGHPPYGVTVRGKLAGVTNDKLL